MMNGRIAEHLVEGTAALKSQITPEVEASPIIIAFPQVANRSETPPCALVETMQSIRGAISDILASSEMYCSLKYEDFRGCPYHMFTRRGIVAISSACALFAVAALAFGA